MRVPWWLNPWGEVLLQRDMIQSREEAAHRLMRQVDQLRTEGSQLRRGMKLPGTSDAELSLKNDLSEGEFAELTDRQMNRVAFQQARELNRALRLALGDVVRAARRIVADPTSKSVRAEALAVLDAAAKETNVGSQP